MTLLRQLLLCTCLLVAGRAFALIETYDFSTPELEERYHQLSQELALPKCQNQNIADSNAPIAQDLRKLLHQQLEQGASDDEILEHMVDRYGEFVRYRPRFGGQRRAVAGTGVPAAGCVWRTVRRAAVATRRGQPSAALDAQEQARLRALLDEAGRDS